MNKFNIKLVVFVLASFFLIGCAPKNNLAENNSNNNTNVKFGDIAKTFINADDKEKGLKLVNLPITPKSLLNKYQV